MPNFGADNDILATKKHWEDQEKIFGHWTLANVTKIKQDYKVPNFGVDSDILASEASLKSSETTLDHVWNATQDENGVWTMP